MRFLRPLAESEMQTTSLTIWNRVADFIFCDNLYANHASHPKLRGNIIRKYSC